MNWIGASNKTSPERHPQQPTVRYSKISDQQELGVNLYSTTNASSTQPQLQEYNNSQTDQTYCQREIESERTDARCRHISGEDANPALSHTPRRRKAWREPEAWHVRKFIEGAESRMARDCCLRALLTLLHVGTGLTAGFYTVYSLVGEGYNLQCLPEMVDRSGNAIPFGHGLPAVCHAVFYSVASLCAVSFLMALLVNCCFENACMIYFQFVTSVTALAVSVFGGATLTVHSMLWCDSLSAAIAYLDPYHRNHHCKDAAKALDHRIGTTNTTMYYTKVEVQQIGMWALFPLSLFAVVSYASAIYLSAARDTRGTSMRGYVVLQEETSPLLGQGSRSSCQPRSQPMVSPVSAPPPYMDTDSGVGVNDYISYTSMRPRTPSLPRIHSTAPMQPHPTIESPPTIEAPPTYQEPPTYQGDPGNPFGEDDGHQDNTDLMC